MKKVMFLVILSLLILASFVLAENLGTLEGEVKRCQAKKRNGLKKRCNAETAEITEKNILY